MRFMIIAVGPPESESPSAAPPSPEAFAAMQQYNEELARAGILLAAEGLAPTSQATRISFNGDEATVVDGPFAESKEVIAGFMIIKVDSKDEALDIVRRAPRAPQNGDWKVEIRQLMDFEDFDQMLGGEFTPNEEVAKVKY